MLPGPLGGWEVRTLGSERMRQRFATFAEALSAALAVQREEAAQAQQGQRVDVVVHHRNQGCRVIKVLEAEPTPSPDDR